VKISAKMFDCYDYLGRGYD